MVVLVKPEGYHSSKGYHSQVGYHFGKGYNPLKGYHSQVGSGLRDCHFCERSHSLKGFVRTCIDSLSWNMRGLPQWWPFLIPHGSMIGIEMLHQHSESK